MKLKLFTLALATAACALSTTASAQTRADEDRWRAAQRRYDAERDIYERERERYDAAISRSRYDRDPYATDYDAARDYRDDPRYGERVLTAQDQVYRGSDGRYYCRRTDGTTGLIIGGATGGVLGNVIDGGRNRGAGTLIGGALGALLGRQIERQSDVRCR